ncbi:DUF4114 domain-containing protein [Catenovulum sp. SM1970]|uniref:DUF4114 domain-containing protein n=1 Tax=Marinifaba aquimaris TaxID=2741323 RepID=UPI001574865D|nr:DUF4114 domain-containing protein [Marinifaba aquimaris]NTS76178.1 DUF4114 domain-containing protein [Marinifaba aquimaris]
MNKLFTYSFSALTFGISAQAQAIDVDQPPITNEPVPEAILNAVATQLPEGRAVNASFLNTDFSPFLSINQQANVSVTFIDEGAGYRNSLGWFSFTDSTFSGLSNGDIDSNSDSFISLNELDQLNGFDYGWLYPNASKQGAGGDLLAGDTVVVGDGAFNAGDTVSFFLGQNSATGTGVSDGVLTGSDQVFYGLDFLNPEADFTSTLDSSLENSRHVALLFADDSQEQVIMGFEDLNRVNRFANDYNIRSDEDFNDAVFIVSADPADAFSDSNIATAPIGSMSKGSLALGFGFIFAGFLLNNKRKD